MCTFSSAARLRDTRRVTAEHNRKNPKRKLGLPEEPLDGTCENLRHPTGVDFPKDPSVEDKTPIENLGRLLQDGGGRLCNYIEIQDTQISNTDTGEQYI